MMWPDPDTLPEADNCRAVKVVGTGPGRFGALAHGTTLNQKIIIPVPTYEGRLCGTPTNRLAFVCPSDAFSRLTPLGILTWAATAYMATVYYAMTMPRKRMVLRPSR